MVNSEWATEVHVLAAHCTPALELLTIKARPFYLPREFSSVILTAASIPPQTDRSQALDELYRINNGLGNVLPDAAFIILGDFNRANMKKVLPKHHQHISIPTRAQPPLDPCSTPVKDCYRRLPRPDFGNRPLCHLAAKT